MKAEAIPILVRNRTASSVYIGRFLIYFYTVSSSRGCASPSALDRAIVVLDALAIAGLILGPMLKYSTSYLVTLRRQREDASFFKRNRDAFILSLLFFVLGVAVTLIVQYFK